MQASINALVLSLPSVHVPTHPPISAKTRLLTSDKKTKKRKERKEKETIYIPLRYNAHIFPIRCTCNGVNPV